MTVQLFVALLAFFAVITSLIVEGIKKLEIIPTNNRNYNILATGIGLGVGVVGMWVYYNLNYIPLNFTNIIFAILMGFASALSAMVGYDKVKQAIEQFFRY